MTHLSATLTRVEYIWIENENQQRIYRCELIVYDRDGENEQAYYSARRPPLTLSHLRQPYHTNEQVQTYIEAEYVGAEVIEIRQTVQGTTDMIEVDAKWTDGYYYTVRYRAWGTSQFAQEQITQI